MEYRREDILLSGMLEKEQMLFTDIDHIKKCDVPAVDVWMPDGDYSFVHEAAVIEFHGTLFASWYNCPKIELLGDTPIRERRSADGGKTWSEVKIIERDETGTILYCPPVYGICDDKLYLFLNEMVSADHIHSLNLYLYDEAEGVFRLLRKTALPFKLNTNVVKLSDGRLVLPGRMAPAPDEFPNIPSLLISDSGRIDADWRLVYIQKNCLLPDGEKLVHPELTLIENDKTLYMFSRDDLRRVPLVYVSGDMGETWDTVHEHNIPFSASKIYGGTLSDGRNYLIGCLTEQRKELVLFLSEKGTMRFTDALLLADASMQSGTAFHYPFAHDDGETLYIVYTVNTDGGRGVRMTAYHYV